jgi:hypothetical protein
MQCASFWCCRAVSQCDSDVSRLVPEFIVKIIQRHYLTHIITIYAAKIWKLKEEQTLKLPYIKIDVKLCMYSRMWLEPHSFKIRSCNTFMRLGNTVLEKKEGFCELFNTLRKILGCCWECRLHAQYIKIADYLIYRTNYRKFVVSDNINWHKV